jgi:hypothetical protein
MGRMLLVLFIASYILLENLLRGGFGFNCIVRLVLRTDYRIQKN